ncbi:hypothetical protein [Marinobacter sp. X15-166B]|uniref:hypothetical protein n=1 Tax=Marinobacter sp. X15-166B TaxID=1897620 RepID=UPI00085BFDBC|nr:hypothetical protein [Marinobacter sp. X15-166B]OEY65812.1 hypothetical protein BG841_04655 [Marinobacter sp. X15-166B]
MLPAFTLPSRHRRRYLASSRGRLRRVGEAVSLWLAMLVVLAPPLPVDAIRVDREGAVGLKVPAAVQEAPLLAVAPAHLRPHRGRA